MSVVLVFGLVAGTLYYLYIRSRPVQAVYQTITPELRDIVKKTVASGRVVARKEIEIKPQVSGIVEEILTEAGDHVKEGQIIARIRIIPDLVQINNAEARLKMAQVKLDDARKTYDRVKKRYLETDLSEETAGNSQSPNLILLNQAAEALNTAEITVAGAQNDYNRQKNLVDKQIISAEVFEETVLALKRSKEIYSKALANYQMIKSQTFDTTQAEFQEAETGLSQAKEELASAKNNLQLTLKGFSSLSPDESNTRVRATIDGMILDIPVKVGASVVEINTQSSGTTIATIADMTDMIFEGSVDESEINNIDIGMDLILTIGAIPDTRFNAMIEHIAPKGVEKDGAVQFNIRADVTIKDPYFIRAGYSAGADIVLDKREGALAVEEGNLIFKNEGVYVQVETQPNTFENREIKVGLSDGIYIEVVSGLSDSDRIKVQN